MDNFNRELIAYPDEAPSAEASTAAAERPPATARHCQPLTFMADRPTSQGIFKEFRP